MLLVSLAVGFGLSWYALTDGRFFGAFAVGPWTAWPAVGRPDPDPYTRAYLARRGALQLGLSEGLQFIAATDSNGQPLERSCRYRIEGTTPVAAFWTLVPIATDGSIVARPDGPAAFRSTGIARAGDGSFVLYVSETLAPGNWLETVGEGRFELALTLYDTPITTGLGTGAVALPAIIREACA